MENMTLLEAQAAYQRGKLEGERLYGTGAYMQYDQHLKIADAPGSAPYSRGFVDGWQLAHIMAGGQVGK